MSAFCSNTGWCAVNDGVFKSASPTITARPTPQEKRVFAELAAQRHMSESRLALIAIRAWLDGQSPELLTIPSGSGPALDRITIRLRPGDRLAIRQRAAERRIKDSAYIAALVRGHVAANPPLTTHELVAFKTAVSILARFGRLMMRAAREAVQTGVMTRDLQQEVSRCRALVSEVERRMHQFAQVALVTWESRVD